MKGVSIGELFRVCADTIKKNAYKHCSRWAVEVRVMDDGTPYSLDSHPYMEEILNSRSQRNVIMKGAQTGLSEGGFTISFFEIDYHKRDVIYYFPTGKMAERFSKTRFKNAVKMSPYLSKVVEDSLEIKQIGTSTLHILGANSITNLKATSAGRLVLDELDEWTDQQIYLAEERMSGQKNDDKIVWMFSTPKYPNMGIHKQYLKTTQERYHFECEACGELIKLDWEEVDPESGDFGSFQLVGESEEDPRIHESYIKCPCCNEKIDHERKPAIMKATGRWVAMNPDADPKTARGFHVSQLYSPNVTPGEIARKYLRGRADEDARREFHNSCLGLPYIEDESRVNDVHIDACIKNYTLSRITTKDCVNQIVTLGVDQGGPYHSWKALKWQFMADSVGDPNDRGIPQLIGCGKILQGDWPLVHGLMREFQVSVCVIDYFPDPVNARVFARKFPDAVYLCQFVRGVGGRELRPLEDDYGANLVRCDKTSWLGKYLSRIVGGDIQLPADLPLDVRTQCKAPIKTLTIKDGVPVAEFVEDVGADHFAFAGCYGEIALKLLDPPLHSSSIIKNIR